MNRKLGTLHSLRSLLRIVKAEAIPAKGIGWGHQRGDRQASSPSFPRGRTSTLVGAERAPKSFFREGLVPGRITLSSPGCRAVLLTDQKWR